MSWKLIDPIGSVYVGNFTLLTKSEAKTLGPGWFPWHSYIRRPDKQDMKIYKLKRVGYTDILGIVALKYNNGRWHIRH